MAFECIIFFVVTNATDVFTPEDDDARPVDAGNLFAPGQKVMKKLCKFVSLF